MIAQHGRQRLASAVLEPGIEVDITEDVPSSSRQLSIFLRRTRQNRVRKQVREVYLRDDITPEPFEGADQILVLDTNIALHQTDFIAEDECVKHVVVPYTVLQEVRHRHFGTHARLRSLCRAEAGAVEAARAESEQGLEKASASAQSATSARNACRFYVFPNEYFRETYVERKPEESQNDRNDRAIRRVAHWYKRNVVGPEVLLLTDDRECQAKAQADGLTALTAVEFAERMRPHFPNAGEKLALQQVPDHEVPDPSTPSAGKRRGLKRKHSKALVRAPSAVAADGALYPPHLRASEVEQGLKERRLRQGVLRMNMSSCFHGTVLCGEEEIEISGRLALNRGIDGDIVAIEEVDEEGRLQVVQGDKRLRRDVGDAEFGTTKVAPSASEELIQNALELARSFSAPSARPQGRVVGIIRRNWREYCGTLKPMQEGRIVGFGKSDRLFIPTDARMPNIRVETRYSTNLENKRIVVVLDGWDRNSHYPKGHWTQILGDVGDRSVESAVILHEHGVITREFGEAILRCLPPADWMPGPEDLVGREDLRDICVCSVDPPGCKDIDDAVSCELLPGGNFRVGVHIADVTHFVHPDTPIDNEAAERCTTVYLVEKRTDMLPGLLTTDICSLRGGIPRLTFSVFWEMTPKAEVLSTRFCKSIIKSRAALSYAEAQARIDDGKDRSEVTKSLRNLDKLAKIIRAERMRRGALELASQEVRFELDSETQDPTDVSEYKLRDTNKMIEEFMLLANQAVATKILDTFPMFSVLRRHPPPKDEGLKTLKKLLEKNGFSDFRFGSNRELGLSLARATKPDEPFFNQLVRMMTTRCMNQAVYFCTGEVQPELYGHYGLAMERYTHFTSPIRRYADVLVHRLLAACLGLRPLPASLQSKPAIKEQCERINMRHHMAQCAGRASVELHTFMYFNKVGKTKAEGIVTRVRSFGMRVVVQRYGIEGVVWMPEEDWEVSEEEQIVKSRAEPSLTIAVFDHVLLQIEADNTDHRNKTRLQFERKCSTGERESFNEAKQKLTEVQKEMFPDQLVREAN